MNITFITFASEKYKKQADILIKSINTFYPNSKVLFYEIDGNHIGYIQGLAKIRLEKVLEALEQGLEYVVLLGADCLLYRKCKELEDLLRSNNIVLVPHITEWLPEDNKMPGNKDIYMTGHCNADIIGFRNTEETKRILRNLINLPMIDDKHNGIFYEQTWLSGLPFMFKGIAILKHTGYNVAYFNITQRNFKWNGDNYTTKDGPLAIFQFSGFDASKCEFMSIYQNRYRVDGDILKIFEEYEEKSR